MKKRKLLSYLLIGLFSTSLSGCNKDEEQTPEKEKVVEEVSEEIVEPDEVIDIDKENDDEIKDEGEIAGSQEEQKFKYTYEFSTNFMELYDTSSYSHIFEVGESPKFNEVTTSLIRTSYDSNGNKSGTETITNITSLQFYLNGRAVNTSYTFKISDIGVQVLTLSVSAQGQVFSDTAELLVYSNSDISEETTLSISSYPRRKFLINSSIDFSNLRIAKQTTYSSGLEEEFTLTKILNNDEYGLLVDNQRYSSLKVYFSTGTHNVIAYYLDHDVELDDKTDSELVSYVNELDDADKVSFTFTIYNQNEINELIIDPEMVINKSYGIGDSLDLSSLNLNYYSEKLASSNSKANSKSVKPLFSSEYKIKQNGSEITSYTFNSTGAVKFDIEVTASNLSKEQSSFTISPIFDNPSIVNNFDDSEDTLNMTFTRDKTNTSIASLNLSSDKGYFSPEEVECNFAVRDFIKKTYACPSKGKVPLVIVPVVFPTSSRNIGISGYTSKDYSSYATSIFWDAIYKSFFGKDGEGELDSLRSYYYKSSYGQLDLCGLMTDYCFIENDLSDLDSTILTNIKDGKDFDRTNLSYSISRWVKSNYNIDSNYDSDGDSVTDAYIFVWIGPRTSTYTSYWDSTRVGTIDYKNKEAVSYLWTSALNTFPYTSNGDYSSTKFRSAIMTHEFGHLIGAFDLYPSSNTYYSYSKNRDPQLQIVSSSSSAQYKYAPMGYYDQMDHDVGDHNMYNKMLFGWIKPYIVYGNVTLDLKSIQHINSAILVYDDDKQFVKNDNGKIVFSPFDEYLLVDYYTNKNLNKDKEVVQYSISPLQGYGGRICHVDARLYASGSYIDDCSTLVKNKRAYSRKNKNTYSSDNSYFEEIRWIQSTAFLTCKSISKSYTNYSLTPNSFFISNGIGANKEFSITGNASTYEQSYSQSFVNGKESKMNNGKVNSSKITFNSLVYL